MAPTSPTPASTTAAPTATPAHPAGTWRLDPGGSVNYATGDAYIEHKVSRVTVDQCKARCADGTTWPGCKGFGYASGACRWASESSQLKPNSHLNKYDYKLYTLLTGRPVDANGCVLGVTASGASAATSGISGTLATTSLVESYLGRKFTKHAGEALDLTEFGSSWTGGGDMGALCGTLMGKLARKETICGAPYTLPCSDQCRKNQVPGCKAARCKGAGGSAYTGMVHCNAAASGNSLARETYYPMKSYTASDIVAVMDLCVTPCMHDIDRRHQCCDVPQSIAHLFSCCRERKCCPDQLAAGRRLSMQPRAAQGASVAVTIAVEDNVAAKSVYDRLLDCLKIKSSAVCMRNTTITASGH